MKAFDLTGKQFNKWTVVKKMGRSSTSRDILWLCRCVCGKERPVKSYYLTRGYSTQCVDCGHLPTRYQEELPNCVWKQICSRARRRNIKIEITKQQAYEVFLAQNRKCALSGDDIWFPENGTEERHKNYTASLDRIDSQQDYTLTNIQWVHKHVNVMKNIYTQEYFLDMCRKITKNMVKV